MGTDQLCLDRLVALHPPKWVLNELPSEKPDHNVLISKGFWIDRTEVTNATYGAFIKAGGYEDPAWWSIEGWKWRKAQAKLPTIACLLWPITREYV
jgi:iron(II)-dependent oxidoreductase